MFSFRNRLSPTTSTLLRLNRSPCTDTVHQWRASQASPMARAVGHALDLHAAVVDDEASARLRDSASIRLMTALLQDAVCRIEQHDAAIVAPDVTAITPNGALAAASSTTLPSLTSL